MPKALKSNNYLKNPPGRTLLSQKKGRAGRTYGSLKEHAKKAYGAAEKYTSMLS
jgi:hypothetical protein